MQIGSNWYAPALNVAFPRTKNHHDNVSRSRLKAGYVPNTRLTACAILFRSRLRRNSRFIAATRLLSLVSGT